MQKNLQSVHFPRVYCQSMKRSSFKSFCQSSIGQGFCCHHCYHQWLPHHPDRQTHNLRLQSASRQWSSQCEGRREAGSGWEPRLCTQFPGCLLPHRTTGITRLRNNTSTLPLHETLLSDFIVIERSMSYCSVNLPNQPQLHCQHLPDPPQLLLADRLGFQIDLRWFFCKRPLEQKTIFRTFSK